MLLELQARFPESREARAPLADLVHISTLAAAVYPDAQRMAPAATASPSPVQGPRHHRPRRLLLPRRSLRTAFVDEPESIWALGA